VASEVPFVQRARELLLPLGPGKYDDLCTEAKEKAEARGAILIIIGGNKGEGFSCQTDILTLARLPSILRVIADEMEASFRKGKVG